MNIAGEIEPCLLLQRLQQVRADTLALATPLSAEDCGAQSMADASPVKWHLAHTTWFFETFVLAAHEPRHAPLDARFRHLFNSYYDAVGSRHPRPQRGLLTRPSLAEVRQYRDHVDARLAALLSVREQLTPSARDLIELGLQHEQQHQELILTDVLHLLAQNPLAPAYRADLIEDEPADARPLRWFAFEGGGVEIGHAGAGFAFDNETPRHRVWLAPYELADRLVTNAEFEAFVAAGGYRAPRWWLAEGWDWAQREGITQPLYWRDRRCEFTLAGEVSRAPARPVCHLSYFEADAYARWAGARLPTEAEWEHAAAPHECEGHLREFDVLRPRAAQGTAQFFGDVWEWTSSSYAAYPGFAPAAGAVGEYNGKFMVNQYVLRGGSCATPADHIRASYRNFFPAGARWQFSGLRLARSPRAASTSGAAHRR